jgi:acyl-CoA synthetase (AMP-forming)/AMP-acid ligase II
MTTSVFERISEHRDAEPSALALSTIDQRGLETSITFDELYRASLGRALALQRLGARSGDLVFLLLEDLQQLATAFLGCMAGAMVPSVLPVQVSGSASRYEKSLADRLSQCEGSFVITTPELAALLTPVCEIFACRVVTIDSLEFYAVPEPALRDIACSVNADDVAFVQFTSGTTGRPKGLQVTHGALTQQVSHYAEAIELAPGDVSVSWSPLYHDQGLVSNFLMPLSSGIHTVLMSPSTWLKKPVRFFEAIDRHRGSISRWPNFAFHYMVNRVRDAEMQGLSLESLRLIANSGEPITANAWPAFRQRFAPYGLRDGVMNGSFGMAENCLCVAVSPLQRPLHQETVSTMALGREGVARVVAEGDPQSRTIVSSGRAVAGTSICIFGADGRVCPERTIGEIGIQGDCLTTRTLSGEDYGESSFFGGYFRTGDLGYLADGWLFVTGRKKDIVIVGGVNVYPEDVERLGATIPEIKPGRLIALGLPNARLGTEQIVVVCELKSDTESNRASTRKQLQNAAQNELSVWIKDIQFREAGWIEKTSSGKLSRFRAREKLCRELSEQHSADDSLSAPIAASGHSN